jgi:hypothetical protein
MQWAALMKPDASIYAPCWRKEERTPLGIEVALRRFGHRRWAYAGVATDVSSGGFGIDVCAQFSVGEVVELRFPNCDKEMSYRVRIVYRSSEAHYGMRFLNTHEFQQVVERIPSFLSRGASDA